MRFYGLLLLCFVYAFFSVVFLSGRGARFLVGYSSLDEKRKTAYNEKKILRVEGLFHLIIDAVYIYVTATYHTPTLLTYWIAGLGILLLFGRYIYNMLKYRKRDGS